MKHLISLKELRLNMQKYADLTKKGESFLVVKQSKPLFKISSVDDDNLWQEVIDFTKIKRGGVKVSELIKRL